MNTKILTTDTSDISLAGEIIANGGLVAFPTETVYGLGANAFDEKAVKAIYTAKGRPSDNPLIVHIAKKDDIIPLVQELTEEAKILIEAFFPGPLTIILKKSSKINNVVSGGLDTVAVRMPQNKIARALINASGCPVAAPSANSSGLPSPTKAKYVIDDMMGKIDAIIDGGDSDFGVESTVLTLATDVPTILRPGSVTKEMIEAVIGKVEVAKAVLEGMQNDEVAQSPGMKYKHYAPQKAKLIMVNATKEQYESFVNQQKDAYALCFEDDNVTIPKITYGKEDDDISQAHQLFDALRIIDTTDAKKVYARIPSASGVGMAVYNRLIRAAAFNVIDLKKPFTIGLTGPSGAGKGYVCEIFKKLGFKIVDADLCARQIFDINKEILPQLQKEFGNDIIENGTLNRHLLADRAFATKEATQQLNAITHPAIIELCKQQAQGLCVLDAPQLFESGGNAHCYKTVAVVADEETRLNRIINRDGISENQARARFSAQLTNQQYIEKCDFVIFNNGEDLHSQIHNILEEIL